MLDADGEELAEARSRTPWVSVPSGAEVDPRAVADTAIAVAARALAESPAGAVAGVGGGGHGGDRRAARPPGRAGGAGDRLARRARGRRGASDRTTSSVATVRGRDRPAGLGALLAGEARLAARASPGGGRRRALARRAGVGAPRSLGGAEAAELSLASRTGMLSLREGEWWPEALSWLGVPRGLRGRAGRRGHGAGPRRRRAARRARRGDRRGRARPRGGDGRGRARPGTATSCTPPARRTCSSAASAGRSSASGSPRRWRVA